jgi:cysteine desulfurase
MKVYLDNAATTRLDPEVLEVMIPVMAEHYGNPSSIHSNGRAARSLIERARKNIAGILNAAPAEIFFTSGGTEADNTAIRSSIETLGLKHAITSRIEHHAVLHTLEHLSKTGTVKLSYVNLDEDGAVDLAHLEALLKSNPRSLVSLMHGNNEVGNLLDLDAVGDLCEQYDAIFHSDTVQTMGHYRHDLQKIKANFIVGAAHKFHGPKGIGFLYVRPGVKIFPFVHGGAQERNMRGGTENIYGIVGLSKALEIAYRDMDSHRKHIENLKSRMIRGLSESIEGIRFNGLSGQIEKSLYTVLNASLPPSDISDMLLFNLDIAGISVSGGSACSSGTDIGSHVLNELQIPEDRANVRFSFGKYNTEEEIDYAIKTLAELYKKESAMLHSAK